MIAEKDFAGRQMRGARELQEDAYAFSDLPGKDGRPEGLLVVVADGMGGHNSGERASEVALEAFVDSFHRTPGPVRERLRKSMAASNTAIAQELERAPELEGMGTTLLAAAVTRDGIHWISVGDSVLYLLRKGELKRLNADHSFRPYLREMIESGELTPEKAAKHPFRNLLRSALLGEEIELTDAPEHPFALEEGDLILAATDGLQTLSDDEIAGVLAGDLRPEAATPAAALLHAVQNAKKSKQDNATVAVILFAKEALSAEAPADREKPDSMTKTIIRKPGTRRS
jgi:protein phosphatase